MKELVYTDRTEIIICTFLSIRDDILVILMGIQL